MVPLALLALLSITPARAKLACKTPVVCDPSLESDIFINAFHIATEALCEESCHIAHPNNPCKFFTWVPGAQDEVPNCYQMKACNEMADPITGSQSGAWSCEDPEIFCSPIGDIPTYDDKKTVWTCDHNVHPYGDADKFIFQDTTCRTTCPSFEQSGAGPRADIVVSSKCVFDETSGRSVWEDPNPNNIVDSSGAAVGSASATPTPGCGCKDLVLTGTIQEEDGKVFECTNAIDVNDDGNTVITQDNECALLCDGILVFDLFCSVGQWSIDYLDEASDIYCYRSGSTDSNGYVTLSTFWPPVPTKPTEPTQPTEPSGPSEASTEPTEPTGPSESSTEPTEPTEPTEHTGPSEASTEPTEPTEPTQPTGPSEASTEPTGPFRGLKRAYLAY